MTPGDVLRRRGHRLGGDVQLIERRTSVGGVGSGSGSGGLIAGTLISSSPLQLRLLRRLRLLVAAAAAAARTGLRQPDDLARERVRKDGFADGVGDEPDEQEPGDDKAGMADERPAERAANPASAAPSKTKRTSAGRPSSGRSVRCSDLGCSGGVRFSVVGMTMAVNSSGCRSCSPPQSREFILPEPLAGRNCKTDTSAGALSRAMTPTDDLLRRPA